MEKAEPSVFVQNNDEGEFQTIFKRFYVSNTPTFIRDFE